MATRPWNLYQEMEALQREIDRTFENFGFGRWEMPFSRTSFLPGRAARAYPYLNVSEDEDNFYVEALAPGANPENMSITLNRRQLTISGEKTNLPENVTPESFHRNERAAGKFARTIDLPGEVKDEGIRADYRNGLILITMPKSEEVKPKRINVSIR